MRLTIPPAPIQVPHLVVLGVMDVHGLSIHIGLQRSIVIGQSGEVKRHLV